MIRMIISGCNGRLGSVVSRLAAEDAKIVVTGGFVHKNIAQNYNFPVYTSPIELNGKCDVIIDCSAPSALTDGLLCY